MCSAEINSTEAAFGAVLVGLVAFSCVLRRDKLDGSESCASLANAATAYSYSYSYSAHAVLVLDQGVLSTSTVSLSTSTVRLRKPLESSE